MRKYARSETAALLRKFDEHLNSAASPVDAHSIHDLRVANRRLSRCVQVFSQFYPDGYWKKIRKRLTTLMDFAGAVRDYDIAIELVTKAGIPSESAIVAALRQGRGKAGTDFDAEIGRWKGRNYERKWRRKLNLPGK